MEEKTYIIALKEEGRKNIYAHVRNDVFVTSSLSLARSGTKEEMIAYAKENHMSWGTIVEITAKELFEAKLRGI